MKTFRDALRGSDFVITAQLPLTSGTTAADIRSFAATMRHAVHALQVSDNPSTQPHISPLAAASLSLQEGIDPIVQMSCRDRNRIALQSDLMGAAALGVTSLILTRGEKLPAAHKQRIKGVFDIGAQRLLATAQALSANERLLAAPGFFLGSNATVIDPPQGWTTDGIERKARAGTKFLQTQPCLDLAVLRKYMTTLVARKVLERLSVIVQVPLLQTPAMLRELQAGRRPLRVSSDIATRLDRAGDFAAESEVICVEVLQELAAVPGVSGANLVHRGDPGTVARVVAAAFGHSGVHHGL